MNGYLRIGELSERVGVSADVLRAWERRYGIVDPDRTAGGFRLYSDEDVARVRRMVGLIDQGLSAAEAAQLAGADADVASPSDDRTTLDASVIRLLDALAAYDEPAVQAIFDELLAAFTLEPILREVVVPLLRAVGERWERGELSVGQEHFASSIVRGRLLAIARGWGLGSGRRVVLAAPSGEEHDLGLAVFGIVLWRRGWRVTFLGADTPPDALRAAVRAVAPEAVVVAALRPEPLAAIEDDLAAMARETLVALGGRGASAELAARVGAEHLDGDPVTEAERLSGRRPS